MKDLNLLTMTYPAFVENLRKPMGSLGADFAHMGLGAVGEAGEAADITKKLWVYNKTFTDDVRAHLIKEVGDTLFYLQGLANLGAFTLEFAIEENMRKLNLRYGQGSYSDAAAIAKADKKITGEPE